MGASPSTSADRLSYSLPSPNSYPCLSDTGLFRTAEHLWQPKCFLNERRPEEVASQQSKEAPMGRGILLWLIGVPIPLILLILLFWR